MSGAPVMASDLRASAALVARRSVSTIGIEASAQPKNRIAVLSVALAAGGPPTEVGLLPAGRFRAADGSGRPWGIPEGWLLDDAGAARLVAARPARVSDYEIDYEHQTLDAAVNGGPAPGPLYF